MKYIIFTILLFLQLSIFAQSAGDYRSKQSGNWHDLSSWQTFNGTTFVDATEIPTQNSGVITIRNGHTITINNTIGADQLIVETGAVLQNNAGMYLYDGAGTDLIVNGILNGGNINGDTFVGQYPTVEINGVMNWDGRLSADLTNTGTINFTNGGGLKNRGITNNGTINWNSGTMDFYNGIIVNNVGAVFTINSDDQMYPSDYGGSVLTNYGTVIKQNSTGQTAIGIGFNNNGTLKGIGTYNFYRGFNSLGTIEPGTSPGILHIIGGQPLSSSSTLLLEIKDGSGPGSGHDQLVRNDNLTLAGTLKVVKTGNVPVGQYTIIEVSSGTITGSFSTLDLPEGCSIITNATSIELKVEDVDSDKDGVFDSQDCAPNDASKWHSAELYIDKDGDGYDKGKETICYGAKIPAGYIQSTKGTDCNDNDANINPATVWYKDTDNDGYSDGSTKTQCDQPAGYKLAAQLTATNGDCVDDNASIHPGATEICGNGIDEDCDESDGVCVPTDTDGDGVPDNTDCAPNDNTKWQSAALYIDADNDGYDNGQTTVCYGATIPDGYKNSTLGKDCKDDDASIHPGATEICDDGKDNDCDGEIDEGCNIPEPTEFYSKPSGDLHNVLTWGVNPDGSGANPTDFGTGKTFNLANRSGDYMMTGNWTVMGTINNPSGSQLKINGYTLSLTTLTGMGTLTGSMTSSLIIAGTAGGNFGNINFTSGGGMLKDFTLNRSGLGSAATIGTALSVYDVLTISSGALNTGGRLTLKSTATNTARVAAVTGSISGNVTVERYIPARRAWRLMNAPVSGTQTVNQAWQEGATTASAVPNPNPGYGTHITGGSLVNGFDQGTQSSASLKRFTAAGALQNVSGTNSTLVANTPYMLFVRGDRSITLAGTTVPANNTTLRATGPLLTGNQTIPVGATGYIAVANPFASPINFATITRNNVKNSFYLWDPKMGGTYGVGAYVNVSFNGTGYDVTPASTSPESQYIQSGQSFLVQSTGTAGSLVIKESDKSATPAQNVFRQSGVSDQVSAISDQQSAEGGLVFAPAKNATGLRVNLQPSDGSQRGVLDEVFASYSSNFSDEIDNMDALKVPNVMENLSIIRKGQELMVDRRNVIRTADTLRLNMTNLTATGYMFEFSPIDLSEAESVTLIDNYLKTTTDISLTETSQVYFQTGSDSRASAPDRFCVVIVKNRSAMPGVNLAGRAIIRAYPNPVTASGNINLQFGNIKSGMYRVELVNSLGQTVYSRMMQLNEGTFNQQMNIGRNLPAGVYQMKITGKDSRTVIKIMRR